MTSVHTVSPARSRQRFSWVYVAHSPASSSRSASRSAGRSSGWVSFSVGAPRSSSSVYPSSSRSAGLTRTQRPSGLATPRASPASAKRSRYWGPPLPVTAACSPRGPVPSGAKLDLADGAGAKVGEQRDIALGPESRHRVDHAQRADHLTRRGQERHAGVGDPAEVPHRGVGAEQRMPARVLDHQRLARAHHMAAEGMAERRRAPAGPRLGQPGGALEELAVVGDDGDQRDGRAQQPGRHPGEPVEPFFGRGVQQLGRTVAGAGSGEGIYLGRFMRQPRRWAGAGCVKQARASLANPFLGTIFPPLTPVTRNLQCVCSPGTRSSSTCSARSPSSPWRRRRCSRSCSRRRVRAEGPSSIRSSG